MNLKKLALLSATISLCFFPFSEAGLANYKKKFRLNLPARLSNCWYRTDFYLHQGSTIAIKAKGKWSNGGSEPQLAPPKGFSDYLHSSAILRTVPFASLIGKIGNRGNPFFIGNGVRGQVYQEGYLYLGINDNPKTCLDNSGSLEINLTINSFLL